MDVQLSTGVFTSASDIWEIMEIWGPLREVELRRAAGEEVGTKACVAAAIPRTVAAVIFMMNTRDTVRSLQMKGVKRWCKAERCK